MGAALGFIDFLASPLGLALVISSGLFCFISGRAHQQIQQRLDACQQRLEALRKEHQVLQQRLIEGDPRRRKERRSKGLETLGPEGRWR